MVRKIARILAVVRDAVAFVLSLVIVGSSWGRWTEEPVFLVLDGVMGVLVLLSALDVVLVALRSKRRGIYQAISVTELVLSAFLALIFLPLGAPLTVLNIVVIMTLWEKKTPEELLKHPPVPITRNYRVAVVVGLLVTLVSVFLPWVSGSDSISLLGLYSGILTHSPLPQLSIPPAAVILVLPAIVFPPIVLVLGGLGLIRRRLSFVAGLLSILAGGGVVATFTYLSSEATPGLGSYGFIIGGSIVVVAFLAFRKNPTPRV